MRLQSEQDCACVPVSSLGVAGAPLSSLGVVCTVSSPSSTEGRALDFYCTGALQRLRVIIAMCHREHLAKSTHCTAVMR